LLSFVHLRVSLQVRVPLHTTHNGTKGLPRFLCNTFAGNARQQLLFGVYAIGLLTLEEVEQALKEADKLAMKKQMD